ncbi:MAG: hypothetical protein JWL69_1068 [Phycisphaerales bacterium]|nr:hypothetical protein [Phycisphaerales bacterium]
MLLGQTVKKFALTNRAKCVYSVEPMIRTHRHPLPAVAALALLVGVVFGFVRVTYAKDAPKKEAPASDSADANPSPSADATPPTSTHPKVTSEEKRAHTLEYLEKEYGKRIASIDWTVRSLGVILLARVPGPSATKKLFEVFEKDKHDMPRLLAWQALLARAPEFEVKENSQFLNGTLALSEKGAINGEMRIALVEILGANLPTAGAKKAWERVFTECNAWEPGDLAVLDALGDCLKTWHSGQIAERLISFLAEGDLNVRAEYVLVRAGCPVKRAYDALPYEVKDLLNPKRHHRSSASIWKDQQEQCVVWLKKDRAAWRDLAKLDGKSWQALQPHYIPAPPSLDSIDIEDDEWRNDMELGRPDLKDFEAVFCVDATGSMGDVLRWLNRDVARMMAALTVVCKEPPKVGITFYRDFDCSFVVRHVAMSQKMAALTPELERMTADGGGDIPEAVREGLQDAFKNNPWTKSSGKAKVIILVGDAPPHENAVEDCYALAKKCGEAGIKIHAVKCTTSDHNDLTTFDQIAKASGGSSLDVSFPLYSNSRYINMAGKPDWIPTIARPECQLLIAPAPVGDQAGARVLLHVLQDAVSPKYRARMEPFSRTLLAYVDHTPPEKRLPFPANTPVLNKGNYKAQ